MPTTSSHPPELPITMIPQVKRAIQTFLPGKWVLKALTHGGNSLSWDTTRKWGRAGLRLQSREARKIGEQLLNQREGCKLLTWSELDFPGSSDGKASAYNVGGLGSISGSGRSPGEGNGSPLQFSCLENPMDGGAWWATVHGVTKSRTWLSNSTTTTVHKIKN